MMKKNTKSLFLIAALLASYASHVYGSNVLITTPGGPDTARTLFNSQAALLALDNSILGGLNFGINGRISNHNPLYLGAEAGAFISNTSPTYAILPLLGSLYYQFEPNEGVHPLLGVLAGPIIATGGTVPAVRMGLFFRPGINFEISKSAVLNIEARFGVLGSSFVFAPALGVIWPI